MGEGGRRPGEGSFCSTLALILAFSPGEKELRWRVLVYRLTVEQIQSQVSREAAVILLLRGEKAGMREVQTTNFPEAPSVRNLCRTRTNNFPKAPAERHRRNMPLRRGCVPRPSDVQDLPAG